MAAAHDHEVVSIYGFSKEQIDRLMTDAGECVLMWRTRDNWPVGVTHAYVWQDQRIWITFAAHRHRAEAIRRDPRVSVAVSGVAAGPNSPKGAITVKGRAVFHEDQATKDWFYPALGKKVGQGNKEAADAFAKMLDSPLRVILEVIPEKWITFDADKSAKDLAGALSEDEKTPRTSSDARRMNQERARRGLPPR